MSIWGNPPAEIQRNDAFRLGEVVYSGTDKGTVVAVDADARTISVEWVDAEYGPITYPDDASYLRRALPWE